MNWGFLSALQTVRQEDFTMPNQPSDLKSFIAMARAEDYLILDTETTGLKKPAEIVEISIVDRYGLKLIDQLVCPRGSFGPVAQEITGITREMVKHRSNWAQLQYLIQDLTKGRNVVVWNAVFDRQMFHLSDESNGLPHFDWSSHCNWFCAMTAFGEYAGEWNDYYGNYKWWKLTDAIAKVGSTADGAHRAMADCLMTAYVVRHMMDELQDVSLEHIGEQTDLPFIADDDPEPDRSQIADESLHS
jgi:DNA polymerase-3 subunit epsilon